MAHTIRVATAPKQNKCLIKEGETFTIKLENDADLDKASKIMAAAMKNPTAGEKTDDGDDHVWSIADTGSSVTGADAEQAFPKHTIRPSKHRK